jgi:chemotaxis methyl-accepting protein methylase
MDEAGFAALTRKIARERGFEGAHYKASCLRRRIAVRMRARGVHDYEAYAAELDRDPAEWDRLLDAITINVTKLWRNASAWDAVAHAVLPGLADRFGALRCWSAGCATGEEAYTLAMLGAAQAATWTANGRTLPVDILATDVDPGALARAEAGRYAESAFDELPPARRERWFTGAARDTAGPELRALVRFARHDLLADPAPAAGLGLITCRNVIIYFDRAAQESLFRRFHDALAPGGVLVLGKVESLLGDSRALFEPVDLRERIFRKRA